MIYRVHSTNPDNSQGSFFGYLSICPSRLTADALFQELIAQGIHALSGMRFEELNFCPMFSSDGMYNWLIQTRSRPIRTLLELTPLSSPEAVKPPENTWKVVSEGDNSYRFQFRPVHINPITFTSYNWVRGTNRID